MTFIASNFGKVSYTHAFWGEVWKPSARGLYPYVITVGPGAAAAGEVTGGCNWSVSGLMLSL